MPKPSTSRLRHPIILAGLICAVFFFVYTSHSLHRHDSYNSHAFDLGIYTQITYLYSQAELPYSTLKHMILLADHFGPILAILSPIYRLFPNPITLLILQSLFVSLSGLPIYLIACDKLKKPLISSLITIAYLSSPGIFSAVYFDFHLATISVLPLSLILLTWHFQKWRLYWLTLILSLLFKEDIPIFILGLGIYQLFNKQTRLGLATIIFAAFSFYLIKFQLMPFLWPGTSLSYIDSSTLPITNPIDMAIITLTHPSIIPNTFFNSSIKTSTFEILFRQFGFLSLLDPLSWLTVIPYLFLRFSSNLTQLWTNNFHHNANLIPFLAVSAIMAIARFRLNLKAVSLLLIFGILTGGLNPYSTFWTALQTSQQRLPQYNYIQQALSTLPPNAAISAQSPLVPRLSNRVKIYLYPEIYDADFIVLNSNLDSYPLPKPDLLNRIKILANSPFWKIYQQSFGLIIFSKVDYPPEVKKESVARVSRMAVTFTAPGTMTSF